MNEPRVQRRLAAILAADVAGYSRMMAQDEKGTLERLKKLRLDIMDPQIAKHNGRLVKLMGDGALVEFSSVVEALECAVSIQQEIGASPDRSPDGGPDASPGAQRICLRIGINLGEVIVEGDDIYGDGVNIASRLEGLAGTGDIVISASAYDQVRGKVPLAFEDLGDQQVKNMPEPVRCYRVMLEREARAGALDQTPRQEARKRPTIILALGAMGLAAVIGAAAWWLTAPTPSGQPEVTVQEDSAPPPAPEGPSATDRPSIVVVPFDNLSGSEEQSYFADGITESLITDLSRVSGLLVIARNTSFTLKDQPIDLDLIAEELGVRYVLEGSIQKAGTRVRINANLIDALSGYQIWAEKLDRELVDLFALQDEITGKIIDALEVQLTQEERKVMATAYTTSLEAYDLYLRAWQQYWEYNDQSRVLARSLLNRALQKDPNFARAMALLAMTYTSQVGASLDESDQDLDRAQALAAKAVKLDPQLPQVHWVLGLVHMFRKEYEQAETSTRKAIELDPNFADAYALLCWILQYSGEGERGLEFMETALRLNPRAPFPYLSAEAETYFSLGRYQDAISTSEVALRRNPTAQRLRLFIAASKALAGDVSAAEWEVEELLLLEPALNLGAVDDIAPYRDPEVLERLKQGLRLAGLPGE